MKPTLNDWLAFLHLRCHEFTNRCSCHVVFQTNAALNQAHRLESTGGSGKRSAPHLSQIWTRLAGVGERNLFARLPTWIDAVYQPQRAEGLGKLLLSLRSFHAGDVIGALRHRHRSHTFASPYRRHPEQIGVKTCPALVAQIQNNAAWREIVRWQPEARCSGVEHRGKEREVRLHKLCPSRLSTLASRCRSGWFGGGSGNREPVQYQGKAQCVGANALGRPARELHWGSTGALAGKDRHKEHSRLAGRERDPGGLCNRFKLVDGPGRRRV